MNLDKFHDDNSMCADQVTARVLPILAKQVRQNFEPPTQETCLESLGIDSLSKMEIMCDLEDEFNISIPNSNDVQQRFKDISTLADVVKLVESLLQAQPAAVATA